MQMVEGAGRCRSWPEWLVGVVSASGAPAVASSRRPGGGSDHKEEYGGERHVMGKLREKVRGRGGKGAHRNLRETAAEVAAPASKCGGLVAWGGSGSGERGGGVVVYL